MKATVFTCGDINGIGPEIVFKTLNKYSSSKSNKIVFTCPKNVFLNTAKIIKPKFSFSIVKQINNIPNTPVTVLDIGNFHQTMGMVTKSSGLASFKSIMTGIELIKSGTAESIVTAPISKQAFSGANIKYPGHTELLADVFRVKKYVMMFISKKMKAGLVTIHVPIDSVSKLLNIEIVMTTIDVVHNSLINDFNIINPRIALLGLNPHAGENGNIGNEENKIIIPALKKTKGNVYGPFVPDAFFGNKLYKDFDCTMGMYHDQVLIPFKLMNFNRGVNFTAGLPIVRTSPDHGTALDIAGSSKADPSSMIEAYKFAKLIVKNRKN